MLDIYSIQYLLVNIIIISTHLNNLEILVLQF